MKFTLGRIATYLIISGALAVPAVATTSYNTSLVAPECYTGNGCINTGFTVFTDGNLELGLGFIIRTVGPIDPGPDNVYNSVPLVAANPAQSQIGLNWSVNQRAGGGTGFLGDGIYTLRFFNDTAGTMGTLFDPVRLTPDNSIWNGSETNAVTFLSGSQLGSYWGAQNTTNQGFFGVQPGFDPNAQALYHAVLTYTPFAGGQTSSVTAYLDTRATPEPGSLALLGSGLLAVGILARKRRR